MRWIYLLAGGVCGTWARYQLSTWINESAKGPFALGTMAVNGLGCFAIGAISVLFAERLVQSEALRLFLVVGFLGAFTTFSAYMLESAQLAQRQQWLLTSLNLFGSVVLGVVAFALGSGFAHVLRMK